MSKSSSCLRDFAPLWLTKLQVLRANPLAPAMCSTYSVALCAKGQRRVNVCGTWSGAVTEPARRGDAHIATLEMTRVTALRETLQQLTKYRRGFCEVA